MEETFRRATRIRTLPTVAKMERKMFRAIKNIHNLDGISIGVESHRLGLMQKKRRFQRLTGQKRSQYKLLNMSVMNKSLI